MTGHNLAESPFNVKNFNEELLGTASERHAYRELNSQPELGYRPRMTY